MQNHYSNSASRQTGQFKIREWLLILYISGVSYFGSVYHFIHLFQSKPTLAIVLASLMIVVITLIITSEKYKLLLLTALLATMLFVIINILYKL